MAYAEIVRLPVAFCREFGLRERLRCEYLKDFHPLRPDFPPDLILRDQEYPDLVLKDEITGEFWALMFLEEITVDLWPYGSWWRTGIRLNDGWNWRMRNGEIVVSQEALAEPATIQADPPGGFGLEVIGGETVYTPPTRPITGQEVATLSWAIYFGEEITVEPWPWPIPYNGLYLGDESPSWTWRMANGEILLEEFYPLPVPYLAKKPDRWRFGLEMIDGEMVYTPFFEAVP